MKYIYIIFIICLPLILLANNLQVDNVALTGQNTTEDYTMVQFDISWDNSWRNAVNWDAAWVFVKYREGVGEWHHARLDMVDGSHTAPSGSVIKASNYNDSYAPGVFIYRDASGGGSNDWNNVQLRWNYGENGLIDEDIVTVKVFAIEMVYVSQGTFELGDGNSQERFYDAGLGSSQPFTVNSQGSITISQVGSGNLYATGNIAGGTSSPYFPTGYNAFYCMKYEITQEQYVDFLNTLTRIQQNMRTETDISSTTITNRYIMCDNSERQYRNGIRCDATLPASGPIIIYCDYDGDGIANESNDGQNIACNYISWVDGCAYACWAGLRPMTELEFEKACRGDQPAVDHEFAWGNSDIYNYDYSKTNLGSYDETINNQPTNIGNALWTGTAGSAFSPNYGPVRVGIFALSSTTREESGASYYGIMEFTGNLVECTVSIGNSYGRNFTGNHGGGELSSNGNAMNVTSWPGWDGSEVTGASGMGLRGSHYNQIGAYLPISDRTFALNSASRSPSGGCRFIRTAP